MPVRTLRPAEGVHAASVGPDLVALDLKTDAYFCLPGLGSLLSQESGGRLRADATELQENLVETGLFTSASLQDSPRSIPPRARRTSRAAVVGRGRPHEAAEFMSAVIHAGRTFHGRELKALITRSLEGRPVLGAPDHDLVARRAVLFDRWLPWAPGQGLCLYRAYVLRRFLRSGGMDADWVFGVRTWPFSAHCWLQSGDLLLDDDLDRVGLYTPIMAA